MAEITRILEAIDEGDAHAAEELLPMVYDALRQPQAVNIACIAMPMDDLPLFRRTRYHIATVYANHRFKAFVNGEQVADVPATNDFQPSEFPLLIGASPRHPPGDPQQQPFDGT